MALLLLNGPIFSDSLSLLTLQISAAMLGVWAALTMGIGCFGISPELVTRARLVTSGPYQWIRHPMYTAVLLFFGVSVWGNFSWWRLAVFAVLLGNLLAKLHYEESLLLKHFQGYAEYRKQTKRIIPFLY